MSRYEWTLVVAGGTQEEIVKEAQGALDRLRTGAQRTQVLTLGELSWWVDQVTMATVTRSLRRLGRTTVWIEAEVQWQVTTNLYTAGMLHSGIEEEVLDAVCSIREVRHVEANAPGVREAAAA